MNPQPSSPSPKTNRGHKKPKDALLNQIINYLRLNHDLREAYLLCKKTTTTQSTNNFFKTTPTNQRSFTYTLLIITKSPRRMSGPHQPTAHNVMSEPQPVIANLTAGEVKQPHQSTENNKFNNKVTPQHCGAAQLQDTLHNHTQKQARVVLIPFTLKAVRKQLNTGCNFLSKTIANTPCIYKYESDKEHYHLTSPLSHAQVKEELQREWDTRYKRALYLHQNTNLLNSANQPEACFEILQSVLEQTCLGLIYVFMEYKPAYTGLLYLLHLCSLFTDLPEKVFSTSSYQTHHLLHHLQNARNNHRHKTRPILTLQDADRAWKKCGTFLHQANTLALRNLQ
jgi:hypothetical protein